uniref:Uncharacterized protein n=1 Tax=Cacopsylla melanoneura TaxID=428564 RepID=A0A8D8ZBW0_9HEMI
MFLFCILIGFSCGFYNSPCFVCPLFFYDLLRDCEWHNKTPYRHDGNRSYYVCYDVPINVFCSLIVSITSWCVELTLLMVSFVSNTFTLSLSAYRDQPLQPFVGICEQLISERCSPEMC